MMLKRFFKNLYYYPNLFLWVVIIWFAAPVLISLQALGIIEGSNFIDLNEALGLSIGLFIGFFLIFLVVFGIPINLIANGSRRMKSKFLEKKLGKKLIEEVNALKNDSQCKEWDKKNKEYVEPIKSIIINKLTEENADALETIKNLDKQIYKLEKTIKSEKKSTAEIIARHPFVKTLKGIQNRAAHN